MLSVTRKHFIGASVLIGLLLVGIYLYLRSHSVETLLKKGDVFLSNYRFEESRQAYEKASQLDPKNAQAYEGWALALWSQGKFDKAIKKHERALQLDPKYVKALDG